ncbi:MAG: biopolymer transporter ExbD [Pseudomonadota bacterium]
MRNVAPFVRRRMSLTPLVDVIFLLLLFFMLSSTFATFGEIELSQAASEPGSQTVPIERTFVQIGPERLLSNGSAVTLDQLAERVQDGQVLISVDNDTTSQRLVDLLVRLRGHTDLSVVVLE